MSGQDTKILETDNDIFVKKKIKKTCKFVIMT